MLPYQSKSEPATFIALLKHFGIYQPQDSYKIVCPFHADQNASLQINVDKAYFYCYAECGAKGGSLELYKNFWKINPKNKGSKIPSDLQCLLAIQRIVKSSQPLYNNIYIYNNSSNSSVLSNSSVTYSEGLRKAKSYYFSLPVANWFKPSKIEAIEEETRVCKEYMQKRGFTPATLTKAKAKPSLNTSYPIVFPMFENTLFRGYVMRTFDKEIEQKRKYLYNEGFKRERTLAGEFGIKATGNHNLVLVEGFLDKVKANQLGIHNVAALLGWKATTTQIKKIKEAKIEKIICATDHDSAGQKGYRYLKFLSESGLPFEVIRIHYPKGIKDMGDLKRGTREAEQVLRQIYQAEQK